ncbi:MAG: glutathione ABC transporter permease [Desulfobacterales bacterium S3730MH5]|jgi:peptide/nickel transport system permease protein|nr:MAG: glutathione ABC transporter permease [Desulfobacterales bacterium S3730MH5]
MLYFILKRITTAFFVFIGATFFTFAMMMFAPGDAALEIAIARYGGQSHVDQATIEWIKKEEGLDKPFWHQYFHWLKHVATLDLGHSLVEEAPVMELICTRFARTFELAVAAILIALAVAIPMGILAGVKEGSWMDSVGVTVAVFGVSMPNYWLGLVLIIVFCVKLKCLPSFGYGDWHHMILPAVTLGTALTAYTTRILRSAIIETLRSEYLLALRARGISKRLVIGKHILKNALIPVVTVVGLEFGMILEGAVITETIFAWPGLGDLLVSAISNRDYPLIRGLVLFTATVFLLINLAVDMIYTYLDPRIRLS